MKQKGDGNVRFVSSDLRKGTVIFHKPRGPFNLSRMLKAFKLDVSYLLGSLLPSKYLDGFCKHPSECFKIFKKVCCLVGYLSFSAFEITSRNMFHVLLNVAVTSVFAEIISFFSRDTQNYRAIINERILKRISLKMNASGRKIISKILS